jgi:hypothetical protein
MILKSAAVPGRPNVARAVIEILNTKGAREKLFNNADPIEVFPPENRRISVAGSQASESDRLAFFRMKAEQFFASMSYADIINNQDVDLTAEKDYICAYYVAYAQLMQENYIKAYNTILSHIKIGVTNQELLSILLVTAEKMREPLASEAKKLYEESISILNEVVDLNDIINTDAVYGADPEKEKHAMKIMAPSVFFEGYEKEKNKPVTELLLEKHKKAVPVFEKNGCVLMAAESYRLLLSKGLDSEKNTRALSRLFRDSENNELANQVEKLTLQNH